MSSLEMTSIAGERLSSRTVKCVLRSLRVVALVLGAAGCVANSPSGDTKTPGTTNVGVLSEVLESAQSACSVRTPPDPNAEPSATPRVFIEAFFIEIPASAHWEIGVGPLSDVARLPGAKLVASPHIIARVNETATMDFGTRITPPGATLDAGIHFKRLTVTPRFGGPGEVIVDLDAAFDTLEPQQVVAHSAPVEVHVRNTFVAHERKAVTLHTALAGYSSGSMLVLMKPYVVTAEVDLRDIFTCKMQERQRVLMRRASAQSGKARSAAVR